MKELRKLSDADLLVSTQEHARKEREITLQVLHHLKEVERRRLFARRGFPSLFEYAVTELSYSAGSAQRRISSMRLLQELPEIEEKIESGKLSLSVLAQAQSFFRQEREADRLQGQTKKPELQVELKREVLQCLEGKSSRQAERELASRATHPEKLIPEKIRAVSLTHSQVSFIASEELIEDIRELQGLLAHAQPGMSIEQAIAHSVKVALKQLRPKAPKSLPTPAVSEGAKHPLPTPAVKVSADPSLPTPAASAGARPSLPTPAFVLDPFPIESHPLPKGQALRAGGLGSPDSPYITVEMKRLVWYRDGGRCTYVDPETGRVCGSHYALVPDHIMPYAVGGETTLENLALKCAVHNQLAAIQAFGAAKMGRFVPSLN